MAKIRFGDYLKSKKNKRALYESDESIAKRVVTLIESDECAVNPRYRLENFARAIELLEQIPGHPDAAEMMKVCLDGIDEAEDQLVRTDYERAKQHLKTAVDEYEYSKAADELDQLLEEIRDRQDTVREQLKEASQSAEGGKLSDGSQPAEDGKLSEAGPSEEGGELSDGSQSAGKAVGAEADKPSADGETASENKDNKDNREDSEETEKGEKKKTVEDLQASLSRYDEMLRETEAFKAQADAKVVRFSRKTSGHRWTVLVVFAVIVGAVVYVVSSGLFSYLVASLEGKAGFYQSAYSRFYKLGDYLDSRKQYEYYREQFRLEKEQDEAHFFENAQPGNSVTFSDLKWKVLEKDGTKLRLVCLGPDEKTAFSNVSYDGVQLTMEELNARESEQNGPDSEAKSDGVKTGETQSGEAKTGETQSDEAKTGETQSDEAKTGETQSDEAKSDKGKSEEAEPAAESDSVKESESEEADASWKSSSLRAYLNDTALNAEFTEAERKALVEQESGSSLNPKYGTALKDKTKDIITILSVEEMQSYIDGDILKTPGVDMWMRTPGRDLESAVYMTAKGNLVLYGDDVTDANLSVCPVIVLDYSKLENYVPETVPETSN